MNSKAMPAVRIAEMDDTSRALNSVPRRFAIRETLRVRLEGGAFSYACEPMPQETRA